MASATLIRTNAAPIASKGSDVLYNSRKSNGLWEAYIGGYDLNGPAILPAYDGHRGGADLSSDGRYVLMHVARGSNRTSDIAEPGKGVNNDIDIYDRVTGASKTLVSGRAGTIWAKFNSNATKLVWAELISGGGWFPWSNDYLGSWRLHIADIVNGAIDNERKWTPPTKAFVETYGWIPGTDKLIFDTDYGIGAQEGGGWTGHWYASQLHTMPDSLASAPVRFSAPINGKNLYHEFAHFNGDGWLYTSIVDGAKSGGMDLWRYRPDGSGRERVTWFGGKQSATFDWATFSYPFAQVTGFPPPQYVVVGSLAPTPDGFLAAVALDANAKSQDAYRLVI